MPERRDTDLLFKALADPSRRKLLDLLHAHDGRTLNELCEHMDMTRQGVTQHLDLLESANLVATVRRGREKLHFLNPVPLQEIYERWIAKFEKPRLNASRARKAALPQSGAAAGDLRALDCQVRKAAPEDACLSETTTGEGQWLDQRLSM
jgi:DNA-binding transcriptional ArsR family regulator